MDTIDTRGHICPMPLVMLIKALKEKKEHKGIFILTDNEISKNNLLSFLKDNNYSIECVSKEGYWSINIIEENHQRDFLNESKELAPKPENQLPNMPTLRNEKMIKKNHLLIINKDKMGQGNDELGEILIKGYFNALSEINEGPEKIIFYNSGVLLCRNKYSELHILQKLSNQGIDLILCGACVDYFKIKDDVGVGRISNMLTICEILEKSEKIVYI
ncbi:MAG: sulfurtransferase-like selenium metabolism protein YedF [Candidatus Cloacimonetes bacterium]|nr:sulfurtransferase-like selenium metabolism protein YedF [Candidatus Cloacimonadota bacterium]